jgi:hypothetical protein
VDSQKFQRTWSKSKNFSQINSIKTYDFSALYTTILYDKLKSRLLDTLTTVSFTKMVKGNNYI